MERTACATVFDCDPLSHLIPWLERSSATKGVGRKKRESADTEFAEE